VRASDENGNKLLEFSTILDISAGGVLFGSRKKLGRQSRIILDVPGEVPKLTKLDTQKTFAVRLLRTDVRDGFYLYGARFRSPLKTALR